MSEHLCAECRFFSPASTCIEKPTWGYCIRIGGGGPPEVSNRSRVTWADHVCDYYECRDEARMSGT